MTAPDLDARARFVPAARPFPALLALLLTGAAACGRTPPDCPPDAGPSSWEVADDGPTWKMPPADAGPLYGDPYPAPFKSRDDLCGLCSDQRVAVPPRPIPELTEAERDKLAGGDLDGERAWVERMRRVFPPPPPAMIDWAKHRERIVDGMILPSPERAFFQRAPAQTTAEQRRGVQDDLRVVFRAGWIDPRGAAQLLPMTNAIRGADAFFAGWNIGIRPFQVVAMPGATHVTAWMDRRCGDDTRSRLAAALALAVDLFQIPGSPCDAHWDSWQFDGFAVGVMVVDRPEHWWQTITIVTDGRYAKYGFDPPRMRRDTGPPEPPWFAVDGGR